MRRIPTLLWLTGLMALLAAALAVAWFKIPWAPTAFRSVYQVLREVWSRPYSTFGNLELTLELGATVVLYLTLLWLVTRVIATVLRTQVLDKTILGEGHKFAAQRVTTYLIFCLGILDRITWPGYRHEQYRRIQRSAGNRPWAWLSNDCQELRFRLILLIERPVKVGEPGSGRRPAGRHHSHRLTRDVDSDQRECRDDRSEFRIHRRKSDELDRQTTGTCGSTYLWESPTAAIRNM